MNAPAADRMTASRSARVDDHPLRRLTAEEISTARDILTHADLVGETTRVAYLGLEEPPKEQVLGFRSGEAPVERRVRAVLLDVTTGVTSDALVSLTEREVEAVREVDCATAGQPPILLEEFIAVDEIVKGDEGWRAAMARRGITDLDLVCPCPLSAGSFDLEGERGRRLLRVLSFVQHRKSDHPWAHPIDGVVAYVDLIDKRVVRLIDHELLPVPKEEGNYDDPAYVGPARTTLRPIEITQPHGPSFHVDGDVVTWEGWKFR